MNQGMTSAAVPQSNVLTTSDANRIERIITELFLDRQISILSAQARSSSARIRDYQQNRIELVHSLERQQAYILMVDHNGHDFFLKCRTLEHGDQVSILQPERILIKPGQRREVRHRIDENNADQAQVRNIMLYGDFLKSFAVLQPKRDKQIRISEVALREIMPLDIHVEFVLRKSAHMNLRMRSMSRQQLPIFVPDKNNPGNWYGGDEYTFITFQDYEKLMRSEERNRNFLSEICEPLRYKDEITFGYVQVTSLENLNIGHYKVVQHVARQLESFIIKNQQIPVLKSAGQVVDVSRNGLAFTHPMQKDIFQKYQN
ncbi:MAG: hypothetical protein KDK39_17560, partial [Leptospiraceae bacterium]|nr:hypothetical protein [Leptospiraceae bacterium]